MARSPQSLPDPSGSDHADESLQLRLRSESCNLFLVECPHNVDWCGRITRNIVDDGVIHSGVTWLPSGRM